MVMISPIAKINDSIRSVKNNGNTLANPAFCGKSLEIKSDKLIGRINWLGDDFDSAMQRLVSGATAIVTQPFFDLNNKNTDEKTRKTSCARTIGKIIAGTLTGVIIRELCIKATKKFTQNENIAKYEIEKFNEKAAEKGTAKKPLPKEFKFKPVEQCLLPESKKIAASAREIKKYRGALGTFAAVGIMIFTNFLIDAPLTTYLTNVFTKRMGVKDNEPNQKIAEGGKQ